jgi:hypothetical protein
MVRVKKGVEENQNFESERERERRERERRERERKWTSAIPHSQFFFPFQLHPIF